MRLERSKNLQFSYSRVQTFKQCKYQYYLRYVLKYKTKFNLDYENALVLGTALHEGIEKSVEDAIRSYYSNYPTLNENHILEAYKLEKLIPKAKAVLPDGVYEQRLDDENFIGFMDLLVDVGNNQYDLYDFKYSNNKKNYLDSGQLHIYKHQFEKLNPTKTIRKLYYVFVPKIKRKKNEELDDYKSRVKEELENAKIDIVEITYDITKVSDFWDDALDCSNCTEYPKNQSFLCNWCDYKRYCESEGKNDSNIIYPEEMEE